MIYWEAGKKETNNLNLSGEARMSDQTPALIEQFKSEATIAGAMVYEAKNADDAKSYILKLAQEQKIQRIVKSKSPLAEQIGLRKFLEKAGLKVTESNIKEWFAQLAEENSLHLPDSPTLKQIVDLITKATGEKLEPDPQVVHKSIRRALRRHYLEAGMGITEAEIAIAETGTAISLCNDGSSRLAAILPLIHVTLIAGKGIVGTLDEATIRLKALSKTVQGNSLPAYITYITGRNTTGDIPGALMARAQGPAEEHVVLITT
jgi:L-lactate utilization protein LutB